MHNILAASGLLIGFVMVMLTLAVLWGLTALMSRVVARFESVAPGASAPTDAAGPIVVEAADPDEELAVIAAAAALMLEQPHRVVRVRPHAISWGRQGRGDIHGSHRIR